MLNIIDLINRNHSWKDRVRILILRGWTNADASILPSDHVFWTDGQHTMHYRASWLAKIPFTKFYKIVYEGDISAC